MKNKTDNRGSFADALFREALQEMAREDSAALLLELEHDSIPKPSEAQAKLKLFVQQHVRRRKASCLPKLAAGLLSAVFIFALCAQAVGASWHQLWKCIVAPDKDYVSHSFQSVATGQKSKTTQEDLQSHWGYVPSYLPMGQVLVRYVLETRAELLDYLDEGDNFIQIRIYAEEKELLIDNNEVEESSNVSVKGYQATYSCTNGVCHLVWLYEDRLFHLSTNLPISEAIAIAESLERQK